MGMDRRFGRARALAIFSCALALAAAPANASADGAGRVGNALAERVADAPPDERIPVIVTLDRAVEADAYAGRRAALIRALRREAVNDQADLMAWLPERPVHHFWLVNAIAVELTPAEIAQVELDPEVVRLGLDRPVRTTARAAGFAATAGLGSGNFGVAAVRAPTAWSSGVTGTGVRVGSIDTGVDAGHPALSGRVVGWHDFVNGRPGPYDDNGHGTHTIGTMVGGATTGIPLGVAPGAQVVVAKALDDDGVGTGSDLLAAAEWISDPDGNPATADQPQVVNNSWSAADANDPWFRELILTWRHLGIVPVFAAGNSGPDGTVGSPAGYPEAIAVGAVDAGGTIADFSSRGPVTWQNRDGLGPAAGTVIRKPDIVAPGVDILSALPGGYGSISGTSMAAPHVAGVAALLKQWNPSAGADQIAAALRDSATDLGPAGPDNVYGAGRIDAAGALALMGAVTADARFTTTPGRHARARQLVFGVALANATHFQVRIDRGEWSAPSADSRVALGLGEGEHVIEVQAVAAPGVTADVAPAGHRVRVDRRIPLVELGWRVAGRTVRFRAGVRDVLAGVAPEGVRWSFGDRAEGVGLTPRHRYAAGGLRRVRVEVTDRAGNRRVLRQVVRVAPAGLTKVRASAPEADGPLALPVQVHASRPLRVRLTLRPLREVPIRLASGARPATTTAIGRPVAAVSVPVGRGVSGVLLRGRPVPAGRYRLVAEVVGVGGVGEPAIRRDIRVR